MPACLLIMNMTPIDKERDNPKNLEKKVSMMSNGAEMAAVVK